MRFLKPARLFSSSCKDKSISGSPVCGSTFEFPGKCFKTEAIELWEKAFIAALPYEIT